MRLNVGHLLSWLLVFKACVASTINSGIMVLILDHA
jgi:hypothetical protein